MQTGSFISPSSRFYSYQREALDLGGVVADLPASLLFGAIRMETRLPCRPTRGSLTSPSYLARHRTLGPPLENSPEIPPSSREEGLRLLHGLATNLLLICYLFKIQLNCAGIEMITHLFLFASSHWGENNDTKDLKM